MQKHIQAIVKQVKALEYTLQEKACDTNDGNIFQILTVSEVHNLQRTMNTINADYTMLKSHTILMENKRSNDKIPQAEFHKQQA
jgi:hypothetical protein